MTRNIARHHWRQFLRHSPERLAQILGVLQEQIEESEIMKTESALDEKLKILEACKQKLESRYRILLDIYYSGDLSLKKIAKEQNIKLGTLQSMMCRIRRVLHSCMNRFLQMEDLHADE